MITDIRLVEEIAQKLLYAVFGLLGIALAISGSVAYLVSDIPVLHGPFIVLTLCLIQLGIVFLISQSLLMVSTPVCQSLFIIYAVLSGVTASSIFSFYSLPALISIFASATLLFATMGIYGWYTSTDLTRYRSLMMMGLVGIIIALLVNLFLGSSSLDTLISCIGVLLFSALTAYDIQFIKMMARYCVEHDEPWHKIVVICALQLYLDFINLFFSMLGLWGREK